MSMYIWGGNSPVGVDPWINLDGRLNAPPGTIQYPHLLDLSSATNGLGRNLALRPPWKVAGVDYHVGINRNLYPTNGSLKDPTIASLPSGVTVAGNIITVNSTSPVTLDGYDFGLHNGLQILVKGVANGGGGTLTVSNSNFLIGTNALICVVSDQDAGGLVLTNVEMDGNGTLQNTLGAGAQGTMIGGNCSFYTVRYNWWKNAWQDGLDPGTAIGQHQSITMEYNLFDTWAWTGHADIFQINNANNGLANGQGITDNCVLRFNCGFQQNGPGTAAASKGQSLFRLNTQVNASECAYNTVLCTLLGGVSFYFDYVEAAGAPPGGDDPCTINNPSLHDNYVMQDDPTNAQLQDPWFTGFYTGGALPLAHGIVNPYENNNVEMSTGVAYSNTT